MTTAEFKNSARNLILVAKYATRNQNRLHKRGWSTDRELAEAKVIIKQNRDAQLAQLVLEYLNTK